MTLGDAAVGSTVIVAKIDGDGAYKRRIMDMGITKGSEIFIRKVAPLGDPVEITVRGYELSVRKYQEKLLFKREAIPQGGKKKWLLISHSRVTRTVVKLPCSMP